MQKGKVGHHAAKRNFKRLIRNTTFTFNRFKEFAFYDLCQILISRLLADQYYPDFCPKNCVFPARKR